MFDLNYCKKWQKLIVFVIKNKNKKGNDKIIIVIIFMKII